jgi:hypothetical protein
MPKGRGTWMSRSIAGGIAGLGWATLGLQLYLTMGAAISRGVPLVSAIISYFSFFTILTNFLIAICLALAAFRPDRKHYWNRPAVRTALTLYIILVAVVYAALLEDLWHPKGLQLVADRLLHDVLPALYVGYWLFLTPKGSLRLIDAVWWQLYPLLYMAYIMARGAITERYPYPFLNVAKYGYDDVLRNGLICLAVLLTLGAVLVILDRLLGRVRWNFLGETQANSAGPPSHS